MDFLKGVEAEFVTSTTKAKGSPRMKFARQARDELARLRAKPNELHKAGSRWVTPGKEGKLAVRLFYGTQKLSPQVDGELKNTFFMPPGEVIGFLEQVIDAAERGQFDEVVNAAAETMRLLRTSKKQNVVAMQGVAA